MKNQIEHTFIFFLSAFFAFCLTGCSNTDKEDEPVIPPVEIPIAERMWISVSVTDDALSVKLPLSGTVSCSIDWNDGNTDTFSDPYPAHTYTRAGKYLVFISGTVTALNSGTLNSSERSRITAVYNWGKTGLVDMMSAFSGCTELTYIAADYEQNPFADVERFNYAFAGCTSLTEIPEKMFSGCRQMTTGYESLFKDCTGLKKIPSGLFDNHIYTTSYKSTFENCTSLTEIPEGLFDKCIEAEDFTSTFKDCTSLTEIPSGLFDNCVDARRFDFTFQNCESLTEIPVELFRNCKEMSSLLLTFAGCKNLQGESPYTIVGSNKVHLYERSSENGFNKPTGIACFSECTALSDFTGIPGNWK